MTDSQVIDMFVMKESGQNKNLVSDGERLFSGDALIAQWFNEYCVCAINRTNYSNDITNYKNRLVLALDDDDDIVLLDNIPLGIDNLYEYAKNRL